METFAPSGGYVDDRDLIGPRVILTTQATGNSVNTIVVTATVRCYLSRAT